MEIDDLSLTFSLGIPPPPSELMENDQNVTIGEETACVVAAAKKALHDVSPVNDSYDIYENTRKSIAQNDQNQKLHQPNGENIEQSQNILVKSPPIGIFVRTRDNIDESKRSAKKSFLKKGSRKGLSSLHVMPASEVIRRDTPVGAVSDAGREKEKIERLEEIQRQHLVDLQKRMDKKIAIRQQINQNNASPKLSTIKPKSTEKVVHKKTHQQSQYRPAKRNSPILDVNKENFIMKKHDDKENKPRNEPLSAFGHTINNSSRDTLGLSQLDSNTREVSKQTKSMKRRLENTLREAERERETVTAWAKAERKRVNDWAEEQRKAIQLERHKASNTAMLMKNSQAQQARKLNSSNNKTPTDTLLNATIASLKSSLDEQQKKFSSKEKGLQEKITQQNTYISQLEERVNALESELRLKCEENLMNHSHHQSFQEKSGKSPANSSDPSLKVNSTEKSSLEVNDSRNVELSFDKSHEYPKQTVASPSADGGDGFTEEPTEFWLQRHLAGLNVSDIHPSNTNTNNIIDNGQSYQEHEYGRKLEFDITNSSYHTHTSQDGGTSVENDSIGNQQMQTQAQHHLLTPNNNTLMNKGSIIRKGSGGRSEEIFPDGRIKKTYKNGAEKETFPDGQTVVRYTNGDIKTTNGENGTVVYYYSSTKVRLNTVGTFFFAVFKCLTFPMPYFSRRLPTQHSLMA